VLPVVATIIAALYLLAKVERLVVTPIEDRDPGDEAPPREAPPPQAPRQVIAKTGCPRCGGPVSIRRDRSRWCLTHDEWFHRGTRATDMLPPRAPVMEPAEP
jgi:hypothetical protein